MIMVPAAAFSRFVSFMVKVIPGDDAFGPQFAMAAATLMTCARCLAASAAACSSGVGVCGSGGRLSSFNCGVEDGAAAVCAEVGCCWGDP